jgi:hypothetical protein
MLAEPAYRTREQLCKEYHISHAIIPPRILRFVLQHKYATGESWG